MMAGAAGAAAVATTVLLEGIGLAGYGTYRACNDSDVNSVIQRRQTTLPRALANDEEAQLDLFFPYAPSPGRMEITVENATGPHRLELIQALP